jgi:hypothetical protein
MASSNCDHAYAMLALQETERALDNVSQKLDVLRAELDERCQPVPRMIRRPVLRPASLRGGREGRAQSDVPRYSPEVYALRPTNKSGGI